MVKLDVISDPICPWCYIGKANLDRALARHPDHPFQLNPEMPSGGMDRREYLETKFGGRDNAIAVYSRIEEAAKVVGLKINFEGIKRTPNTIDAHRLIHWAGLEGLQTAIVSALFKAYLVDGRDIGDRPTLLDVAASCGMDKAMTELLFEGGADVADIRSRDAHARGKGVTGVPTFVVDNLHVVAGAQPPELWDQVVKDIVDGKEAAT